MKGSVVLLGRAAIYFDEVARRGALRRAADVLHIAPSAVDRQIIQLEEELGTKLFERTATGMRMTAAGEVLVDGVRRWRRDLLRIRSEIDNLVGLRRGTVSIALVEGAVGYVSTATATF
ncbi:LysR family transcriptional regulator, partial [Pseudomonas sp. EA_65y_Pfl1_P113]